MTVYLGSVFRAVLTVTLSGLIWALDVALYYSPLGHHLYGEPLDPQVGVQASLVRHSPSTRARGRHCITWACIASILSCCSI